MHEMINSLYKKQNQLDAALKEMPKDGKFNNARTRGEALLKKMIAWDEDMVQRKSKAYDDVENFLNKFSANYMFLVNQTESDIPRVNQSSLDVMRQMNADWAVLKSTANEILQKDIPAVNKTFWDVGMGVVWEE
jgi:hypothetical protein